MVGTSYIIYIHTYNMGGSTIPKVIYLPSHGIAAITELHVRFI